jgi:hypothetical protein
MARVPTIMIKDKKDKDKKIGTCFFENEYVKALSIEHAIWAGLFTIGYMHHKLFQLIVGNERLGFAAILGAVDIVGQSIGSVEGRYVDHGFLAKATASI